MRLLIAGCSFSGSNWGLLEHHDITNVSAPGASNQYIADSIDFHLRDDFDLVVVLWSGVYRVDMIVPKQWADAHCGDYDFISHLGPKTYIHGGGIAGSWMSLGSTARNFFKSQYIGSDNSYLRDRGLKPVLDSLALMQHRGQPFLWGWIYDIERDYEQTSYGHCLGRLGPVSELHRYQSCGINTTPLEWCQQHGQISQDGFHPTIAGYREFGERHILPLVNNRC